MTAKESTAATSRPRKAGQPATMNPSLLEFDHDLTSIAQGRLYITAYYPSSREGVFPSILRFTDAGQLVYHSHCPGYGTHRRCLHTRRDDNYSAVEEVAREYHRREYRKWANGSSLGKSKLYGEDRWFAQQGEDIDAAQRLQRDALCDVIAECYMAKHGRAAAPEPAGAA